MDTQPKMCSRPIYGEVRRFWEKATARRDKLMQDKDLTDNGVDIQKNEISQGSPIARWPDLEVCLERALIYRSRSRVETGSRAGSSRGLDALTDLLRQLAIADPGIKTREVLFWIRKNPFFKVARIYAADSEISWDDDNGVTKASLVCRLKHRLSRVKKELKKNLAST
jgi:hypothetical protein